MADRKDELKEITEKLGSLIKTRRDKMGLTVAQLAKISGISTAVITDMETGKNKIPNLLSFVCLAKELGLEKEFTQLIFPPKTKNDKENKGSVGKIETFLLNYVSPNLAQTLAETIFVLGNIEKMKNQSSDKNSSITFEDICTNVDYINNTIR